MSWAIGAGYMGLYNSNIQKQTAKDELSVLESLRKDIELEKEKNIQADLQEQQYYENISKFAENLLEEDRNAINRKAKQMAASVREHIRNTGGNMRKFFENGGHKMLGSYRSSIINSDEASAYIENKKNMEKILELQQKGLGHLINPRDLHNLQQRQKNGTGTITYSGMLSEVNIDEMAKDYAYGQHIPAEHILDKNYMKILNNYKSIYEVDGMPSREDLLAYVKHTFGDRRGTNSNINQIAFNQQMDNAKTKLSNDQSNAQTKLSVIKENINNEYRERSDRREEQEHQMKMQIQALELAKNTVDFYGGSGAELSEDGQSVKYTNADGKVVANVPVKDINAGHDFFLDHQIFATEFLSNGYKAHQINDSVMAGFETHGGVWTPYKQASFADGTWGLTKSFSFAGVGTYYTPAGARVIMQGTAVSNLITNNKNSVPLKINEDGTVIGSSLLEESGIFTSNGIALENSGGDVIDKNKKYTIGPIITASETVVNGHRRMVMNQTNKAGSVLKKENDEYMKKTYGDNADIVDMPVYMTLKSSDGQIIYKKLDDINSQKFIAQGGMLRNQAREKAYVATQHKNKGKVNPKQLFKDNMTRSNLSEIGKKVATQGEMIFGVTGQSKYDKLIFSFYMSLYPEGEQLQNIGTAIQYNTLSTIINESISKNPQARSRYEEIKKDLENGKHYSSTDIIKEFETSGIIPQEYAERWRNSFNAIKDY